MAAVVAAEMGVAPLRERPVVGGRTSFRPLPDHRADPIFALQRPQRWFSPTNLTWHGQRPANRWVVQHVRLKTP